MKPLRTRYSKVTEIVTKLLENNDIKEKPVDLKRLSGSLDITIRKADLEHRYGLMRRIESGGVIVVNAKQSVVRQRFAIAHMLGHFTLHPEIHERIEEFFQLIGMNTRFRPDENVQEREANYFALSTLIPSSLLRESIGTARTDEFDDIDLVPLARGFSVTANMMLVRVMMERRYPMLKGNAV